MSEVPPYLTPSLIGKASGMTRRQAKSLLGRAGILEKIGGRWVVGDEQLRERLPRVYDRVFAHIRAPGRKRPQTT